LQESKDIVDIRNRVSPSLDNFADSYRCKS